MRNIKEAAKIRDPLADALYKSYPLDIFPTKLLQSKIRSSSFSENLQPIVHNGSTR